MVGGTVGEVIASRHPGFKTGETVTGPFGWQLFGVSDGTGVTKIEDHDIPRSAYLGVGGHAGRHRLCGPDGHRPPPRRVRPWWCRPRPGPWAAWSASSPKIHGCRSVGIAGGPEKCRYVTDELGLDACVDYKAGRLREDLDRAAPDGIDIYFENVGGPIFDTVLTRMNPFGRIPVCGMISQYNALEPYGVKHFRSVLMNRLKVQGFIVSDHLARWPAALKVLGQGVREGRIKYRESIVQGLESAPAAFIGLLAGKNFGKQLVKLISNGGGTDYNTFILLKKC
jgi:NADPH-dependent curcumin reductase